MLLAHSFLSIDTRGSPLRNPPLHWEDLIALGVDAAASIASDGGLYAVSPMPPRLVMQLLREMQARPAPDERMSYMRHVRDILVGLTDWTQATDAPLSPEQRAAWATYRQALRDLPANYSGEGPIPWPQTPG